jgi:hypothetical protein
MNASANKLRQGLNLRHFFEPFGTPQLANDAVERCGDTLRSSDVVLLARGVPVKL